MEVELAREAMELDKDEEEEVAFEKGDQQSAIIKQVIIKDRITPNVLSLVEMIKILCVRTDDINGGAMPYIDTVETNSWKIAMLELSQGRCPLSVIRSLGTIGNEEFIEIWNVNELTIMPKCYSNITDILQQSIPPLNIAERLQELLK